MAINWALGEQPDIIGNALNAFSQGRRERQAQDQQNALLEIRRKEAETAAAKAQREQVAQQRDEHVILGKLLDHATDETTYQQSLAAAKQYGIDTSGAPQTFDPNWVGQQKMIVQAFAKDGGQALSNYGKIAMDEGLQPGTPQFTQRVTQLYTADQVKTIPYTQGGGVAGFNSATGVTTPIIQPNDGSHPVGAAVGAAPVKISGEADYNALPAGAEYIAPDGSHRRKGGGAGNSTGGFP